MKMKKQTKSRGDGTQCLAPLWDQEAHFSRFGGGATHEIHQALGRDLGNAALRSLRERLARNAGMLFVMPKPERASFWMKNTTLPLSVAYINSAGVILEIHDLEPLDEKPVPSAFLNIAYALEMEQGWFNENGILAGDRIQGLPPSRGQ